MRVLVVAAPLVGHLLPLLPLAGALRDAGHGVLLAHGGDRVDTGPLPVRDVAGRVSMPLIALRTALAAPHRVRAEYDGRAGTGVAGDLFGGVNAKMIDEVVALADEWRPDLVVYEPLAASGAVAAARRGVPAVLVESSLSDGPELVAAIARSRTFRRAAVAAGVTALPAPAAVLTMASAGLVGPRAGLPVRPVRAKEITAERLRALLDDPGARAAAGEVAAEIAAMPAPAERVRDLEALV